MNSSAVPPRCWQRQIPLALGLALLAFVPGCSKEELSHYQRQQLAKKDAADYLQALGGKVTQTSYPLPGKKRPVATNVVVLAGVQKIDEEVFQHLKALGRITDLDLSKTNVSDDHLELLNEPSIGSTVLTLNLAHTNVTDQGLEKLTKLNMLCTLILTGTKTTAAATDALRKRLLKKRSNLHPDLQEIMKNIEIRR